MRIYHLTNTSISQMMGIVIQTDNGKVIAIDGGTRLQPAELYRILSLVGKKVDMWFITHAHYDHYGALIEMLKEHDDVEIAGIWHSRCQEVPDKDTSDWNDFVEKTTLPVHELEMDQQFVIDTLTIDVLGIANPEMPLDEEYGNNQSIVLKITDKEYNKDFKLLVMGDLSVLGGEKLLKNHRDDLKCDAVVMAHHGQKGVNRDVYEAIGAKFAFWPTPLWLWENRWTKWKDPDLRDLKTFVVRGWMEELGTINFTAHHRSIMFNTRTYTLVQV